MTLLERQPDLGGRARRFDAGPYRFDAGPTVITAPFVLEALFSLFGETMADHVTLLPVEPYYRMRFADGRHFDYGGDVEHTLAEIARFEPADVDGYRALLRHARKLYDVGFTKLAHVPFDRFAAMLRTVPALLRLRADRSVYELVCRHLRHPLLRRAFSIHPLLVGGNPLDTSSLYGLIHWLERAWGVWYVRGGTGELVRAMAGLFARHGGRVRLAATAERIEVLGRRATGVRLVGGEVVAADLVVSAGDPAQLYRDLLPRGTKRLPPWQQPSRVKLSMGLYVLYFATDRTYPDTCHHTILFGDRYEELLRDVFDRGVLSDDTSLYLHRPTATDPGMAPPGHDSFYVLAPVPNLQTSIDWAVAGPKLRERVLDILEARELPGLRGHLTQCFAIDPTYFRDELLSVDGAGFSVAPLLTQSAWFRFHNRAPRLDNLYLAGAGTHPGAGVPGVVTSARVVEALVRADWARDEALARPRGTVVTPVPEDAASNRGVGAI